ASASAGSGAPTNTGQPTISGTAQVGKQLTANPGTWTGNPTSTFERRRCDGDASDCQPIPGATGQTYTVQTGDLGWKLRILVTGKNQNGSASAVSPVTAIVTNGGSAPTNTGAPSITGTAEIGQQLTANPGTWTGSPTPT